MYQEGKVNTTEGVYHKLNDFDQSWAQLNWFKWWYTDYSPESFVIQADFWWNSAYEKANWQVSGCSLVFGYQDKENFHIAELNLDGFLRLQYKVNGQWRWIAERPFGKPSIPEGGAKILMIALANRIIYYVDDVEVANEHAPFLKAGKLALSLSSGTNKDYGTRCKMTNIGLWIFK